MKKVSLKPIAAWIHRNARELEVAIWKFHFENGTKEDVINALIYYQNEDGGFGNAIDPDNWDVNSSPYATLFALNILKDIEFDDMQHPIYLGIKKYIDTELNFPEGCTFTVITNRNYPHASFHNYDENYNKIESTGVILGFSSFIIDHYRDSKTYPAVMELMEKMIEKLFSDEHGDMGPTGYISLVNSMKQAQLEGYDYDKLELRLKELVNGSIQRNPEQWCYYGYRPSDYIKSKDSIFYQGNEEIINVELDFLHDTLPQNDVWPISWSWFENNDKYPKEAVISLNWWKATKAIERARFLKSFMRIQ
ncbi:hypothetical protein [Clostridium manihotivorum]|uniref:Prenyltransferase and squalene oxidase repeat-containing protein n=1 Tax=Clostridium manihotivorum TaxID=2320868 RepID=A0A3R5TFQ3_9CLOT|nr:hypothetical protein [Clostridium manihotivorum]QAA32354.1 hypothetical protein C1I91_12290 [Clostridium manihotivorum]